MPRHAVSNHARSNAVICEPVRTPIGRYGAMFRALSAVDLGVAALTGLLERTGVPAEAVDDVVVGHCYPNPEAPAIGRVLALDADCRSRSAGCRWTGVVVQDCRRSFRRVCRCRPVTTNW